MFSNPYIHALASEVYIWGMASLITYISSKHHDTPDTILSTIAAFSLFSFSAGVMGFLFFYHPVALLTEGKRKEAIVFFIKTLATFGVVTVLVILSIL